MLRGFLVSILLLLGYATLDPKTIPMFQTNIEIGFPVYRSKSMLTSKQLIEHPFSFNEVLAVHSRRKLKYSVATKNISQQILPTGFPQTQVYAYGGDSYNSLTGEPLGTVYGWPGPAFLVHPKDKLEITWKNNLKGKHMFTIEKNLNFMQENLDLDNFIPNVAHIHGIQSPSAADGGPEGWFTNDGRHGADSQTCGWSKTKNSATNYVEVQPEESLMFYHDHSIAMTRLNVYAGLAGFFVVDDPQSPLSKMFDSKHDIFLAIADRSFNEDGSLYYPSTGPTKEFPNWVPEFYGDVMTVNGKAYPNMNVEQNRYRVRLLNSCNSRGLEVSFKSE